MEKLVRDLIPFEIMKQGHSVNVRIELDGDEQERLLKDKLQEEVEEFLDEPCTEEAADILEVLCALSGQTPEYIVEMMYRKRQQKGQFNEYYVMEFNDGR